jgi:predicted hotdog family 3-hydroxylacyl-ACP dehydratase
MSWPDLRELLPQQGRAVLLDRVTAWTADEITCAVHLRDDFPYMVEGQLPALVGIELMAQAVGAFSGISRRAEGGTPEKGYLVSVRGLTCRVESFRARMDLSVRAKLLFEARHSGSFVCAVAAEGRPLVEATLMVHDAPPPVHS